MEVTVYADVLFALNYLMDLLILFLTVQLTRLELKIGRISAAAGILALYGTLVFVPELRLLYSLLGRVAAGMLAVWMLRIPGGGRGFIKGLCIFAMVSAGCGGVVFALVMGTSLGHTLRAVAVNGSVYFPVSLETLLAGILVSYGLMLGLRRICVRNFERHQILTEFVFCIGSKEYSVTALLDTGCELTVPLTGEGVLLISKEVLAGDVATETFCLSVHTAGGGSAVRAFYPEEIRCISQKYEMAEVPAIGVTEEVFASDGLYRGVYHPKIVREKTPKNADERISSFLKGRQN